MAVCVAVDALGKLIIDSQSTTCVYSLLTQAEINSLNGLNGLFAEYFDFDLSLFVLITGGLLMSFVSGHVLGRIMGAWRKVI